MNFIDTNKEKNEEKLTVNSKFEEDITTKRLIMTKLALFFYFSFFIVPPLKGKTFTCPGEGYLTDNLRKSYLRLI